ncbi:E6 protein [Phocoena phocoena papillomavirus 2]|uniref:Protein E6 n=1 Tax=Phocoena phocoena papillomavirus 2 TaxID=706526 RepID=F2VIR2_9PAPI|nr:E6 protein [Phocoena phocoena papillomavirus 2]ADJ96347.1 E6 protein [Phocoena phocoena papillomavirus 2]
MADDPRTIKDLCKNFDLSVQALLILCVFCKKQLTDLEIWSFSHKQLRVVWKKGFPFAACKKCLEVCALVDCWRNFQRSATAKQVEEDTGKALGDLDVRCMGCYKLMTTLEKAYQLEDEKQFCKIAGYWKGYCINCLTDPPPLVSWFNYAVTVGGPPPLITWGFDPPRRPAQSVSSGSSWTITTSTSSSGREPEPDDPEDGDSSDDQEEMLI